MRLTKKLATLATPLGFAAFLHEGLKTGDKGLGDFLVNILREKQRDVDVDAVG